MTRVWPKLNRDSRGKYSRNLKDWYNGADNRIGFENVYIDDDPKKSFHSLRHTFSNILKQARANMMVVSEILGHKVELLAADRYSEQYGPNIKLQTIRLADYDFDFVGMLGKWSERDENEKGR